MPRLVPRLGALAANLALLLGSVVLFLAFCEFVVFRFVLPGSDTPINAFVDGVVRYAPDQAGVWRVRDEIAAPYRINGQGWNSGIGDYAVARRPGVERIAVVGDSFVEALQVAWDRSVGEQMATRLTAAGRPAEVYRFGISGAPLSQYLQMIRREVGRYRPDWIVVLIVHNDFDESYKLKKGRYTSSFLKLRVSDGRVTGEIPPLPWQPDALDWLRRTATARFFVYRWQIRPELPVRLLLPAAHAATAANTDIGAVMSEPENVAAVTDFVFGEIDKAARAIGARLLLTMDADRQAIYSGNHSQASALNRLVSETAARRHIPFLDLEPVFRAEWRAQHRRFEFASDGHWNEYGHDVAAAAIVLALQGLSGRTASAPQ
jgi:hypothetical protein